MFIKLKKAVQKRIMILAWLSIGAIFIGELGCFFWLFELFSHFMPYYLMAFFAGIFASKKIWQRALFTLLSVVLLSWMNTPFLQQSLNASSREQETPSPLKFIAYNLYLNNEKMADNITWLIDAKADVLFLTEATEAAAEQLEPLKNHYPYGCAQLDNSPFGLALYSRSPLINCEIIKLPHLNEFPYIRAQLADGRIIYGVHPPPPITAMLAFKRNHTLEEIAYKISIEHNEVILMGDLNTTPFSIYYRQFIQKSDLNATSNLWEPTWIPGLLALDHILVKSNYPIQEKGYGPWMGSDHRPIWVIW